MTDTTCTMPLNTAIWLLVRPTLERGDVVTYTGSAVAEVGREFVVTDTNYDGLRLLRRDDQERRLSHVRRISVQPTGEVEEMCADCDHIADRTIDGRHCDRPGCHCVHGTGPELTTAGTVVLNAIVRASIQLNAGVEATTRDIVRGVAPYSGHRIAERALAAVELNALADLARRLIDTAPELGITRDRLDAALMDCKTH